MIKKFITIIIAFIMLFALVGCEVIFPTDSSSKTSILEEYRANALQSLQSYVDALDESHFTQANWIRIDGYLEEGKIEIKAAVDKAAVDEALNTAKERIGSVEIIEKCVCLLEPEIKALIDFSDSKVFWDYTDFIFIPPNKALFPQIKITFRRVREGVFLWPRIEPRHFNFEYIGISSSYGFGSAVAYRPGVPGNCEHTLIRKAIWISYCHSYPNIITMIRHLESLCFVKSALPVHGSGPEGFV